MNVFHCIYMVLEITIHYHSKIYVQKKELFATFFVISEREKYAFVQIGYI